MTNPTAHLPATKPATPPSSVHLAVLKSLNADPAMSQTAPVLCGLFGQLHDRGFVFDERLQQISPLLQWLGTAQRPLPCSASDVVVLNVPSNLADALAANLLSARMRNWDSLYSSVAGVRAGQLAGIAAAAVEAEREQSLAGARSILNQAGMREYWVPVTVYGTLPNEGPGSDPDEAPYAGATHTARAGLESCDSNEAWLQHAAEHAVVLPSTLQLAGVAEEIVQDVAPDADSLEGAFSASDITAAAVGAPATSVDQPPIVDLSGPVHDEPRQRMLSALSQQRGTASLPPPRVFPAWADEPLSNLALMLKSRLRVRADSPGQAMQMVSLLSRLPFDQMEFVGKQMIDLDTVTCDSVELITPPADEDAANYPRPR